MPEGPRASEPAPHGNECPLLVGQPVSDADADVREEQGTGRTTGTNRRPTGDVDSVTKNEISTHREGASRDKRNSDAAAAPISAWSARIERPLTCQPQQRQRYGTD